MGELINGRTPEEIKRGLGWIAHKCDFDGEDCSECEFLKECHTLVDDDVAKDALALIERLEAERDAALAQVPRWISVEERLPEHEYEVLVYTDRYGGRTEFAYYVRRFEAWYQNFCPLIPNVTHWIPLPKHPKEGAHDA